jgi:2,5-diamino-6-(ribosylamino)-4(3H)-pyrimidinone 5'-phosphate reductase
VKSARLRAERVARGMSENPAKVAIVSRAGLRRDSQFLIAGPARVIVFTTTQVGAEQLTGLRQLGIEVYALGDTRVDLPAALTKLRELGIERLMVEGGSTLNFELLRQQLVDELQMYIAPMIFGGAGAPTLAAGSGLPREQAVHLRRKYVETFDDGGVLVQYALT